MTEEKEWTDKYFIKKCCQKAKEEETERIRTIIIQLRVKSKSQSEFKVRLLETLQEGK